MSSSVRIARLESHHRDRREPIGDVDRFWWYAPDCPCSLPAGECKRHPRARENQRPPVDRSWRTLLALGGRGSGKTRTGAELVRYWAESKQATCIGLIGATSADTRDTMILGESGLLAIHPPWSRPIWFPSRRRLEWPNGVTALTFSSVEFDRIRGANLSHVWGDECAVWEHPGATWDMACLALRVGANPQAVLTTTPKTTTLIKDLLADASTAVIRSTSYQNRSHLAPAFFDEIVKRFEGSNLGAQELEGRMIEFSDAMWFVRFNRKKHVTEDAEFNPNFRCYLAVDCGVSRWTGGILYQWIPLAHERSRLHIVADYLVEGKLHEENATALLELVARRAFGQAVLDAVLLDPASSARTGAGPTAESEYQRIFGRRVRRWPLRGVLDSLALVETLLGGESREPEMLIHPRCESTVAAFYGYERACRAGEYLDQPVDPNHPHEDIIDCIRGAACDKWPEGMRRKPDFTWVQPREVF
jgi:phage terminase large subunit-like protein